MKKLNLPVIQNPFPDSKSLSMDEYLKFVLLHLKYTFDKKTYKKWKKLQTVYAPFSYNR